MESLFVYLTHRFAGNDDVGTTCIVPYENADTYSQIVNTLAEFEFVCRSIVLVEGWNGQAAHYRIEGIEAEAPEIIALALPRQLAA